VLTRAGTSGRQWQSSVARTPATTIATAAAIATTAAITAAAFAATTATVAATATATATVTTAATATATATLTLTRFVDTQLTTTHVVTIQSGNGVLRIGLRHLHKAEAAKTASLSIVDQAYGFDRPMLREKLTNRLLIGGIWQIAYVNPGHDGYLLIPQG
jgi:hypothetical protein